MTNPSATQENSEQQKSPLAYANFSFVLEGLNTRLEHENNPPKNATQPTKDAVQLIDNSPKSEEIQAAMKKLEEAGMSGHLLTDWFGAEKEEKLNVFAKDGSPLIYIPLREAFARNPYPIPTQDILDFGKATGMTTYSFMRSGQEFKEFSDGDIAFLDKQSGGYHSNGYQGGMVIPVSELARVDSATLKQNIPLIAGHLDREVLQEKYSNMAEIIEAKGRTKMYLGGDNKTLGDHNPSEFFQELFQTVNTGTKFDIGSRFLDSDNQYSYVNKLQALKSYYTKHQADIMAIYESDGSEWQGKKPEKVFEDTITQLSKVSELQKEYLSQGQSEDDAATLALKNGVTDKKDFAALIPIMSLINLDATNRLEAIRNEVKMPKASKDEQVNLDTPSWERAIKMVDHNTNPRQEATSLALAAPFVESKKQRSSYTVT